jgi:hypothetical protein
MYSAKDVVIDFEVDGGDGSGPCSSTSSAPMTGWVHPARRLGVPDLTLGVHFDNGFFATADGGRGGERLGTIAASWLDGALVVETWNDRFGGEHKDHGPTGGGQIYLRIPNLRGR